MLHLLEESSLDLQSASLNQEAAPPAPKHTGKTPCVTLRALEAREAAPREHSNLCIPALEQGRLSRLQPHLAPALHMHTFKIVHGQDDQVSGGEYVTEMGLQSLRAWTNTNVSRASTVPGNPSTHSSASGQK